MIPNTLKNFNMHIGLNFFQTVLTNGIKNLLLLTFLSFDIFLIRNLILLWILEKIKCNWYPLFKKMLMASIRLFCWKLGWHNRIYFINYSVYYASFMTHMCRMIWVKIEISEKIALRNPSKMRFCPFIINKMSKNLFYLHPQSLQ